MPLPSALSTHWDLPTLVVWWNFEYINLVFACLLLKWQLVPIATNYLLYEFLLWLICWLNSTCHLAVHICWILLLDVTSIQSVYICIYCFFSYDFIWCYHYVIPLIGSGPVKCWPMVCCVLLKSTFLLVGSHYVPFLSLEYPHLEICVHHVSFVNNSFANKKIFEQKEHLAFHSTACLVSILFRTGASRHSNPGTLVGLPGVTWFKVGFCIF